MSMNYSQTETFHGKGEYLELETGRIYFETEGSGPPLIIVPGGPGADHTSYHGWFSKLADRHTIIYFDQSGTGRSDKLQSRSDYTLKQYAWEIEQLRQHLGFEKIAVIGISFGSLPAVEYAVTYSHHISHLIISCGHISAKTWQIGNIDQVNSEMQKIFPEKWKEILELRNKGIKSSEDCYQDLYDCIMPNLKWANQWDHPVLFSTEDPREGMNMEVYLAFIGDDPEWDITGTLKDYDPTDRLKTLQVPSLVLAGRFDRGTPPFVAYQVLEALPADKSKLVMFEQSGHRPWVEESDKFVRILGDFLDDAKRAVR